MLQSMVPDDKLKEMELRDDSMYMEVDYDQDTPKYLKYRGTIRKKRMPKRDCERLLSAIWKRKYAKESSAKMDLVDYLYDYFKCEFGIQSRVVETGYVQKLGQVFYSQCSFHVVTCLHFGALDTLCSAPWRDTDTMQTANCLPPF